MSKSKSIFYYLGVGFAIFVIVCLGVLTGYRLGQYAIDNQNQSASAEVDYSVHSSDYTATIGVDGYIFSYLGFKSSSTSSNWTNLTSGNGNYQAYKYNFYLKVQQIEDDYLISGGVSAYNSGSEYLRAYASGDRFTYNNYVYSYFTTSFLLSNFSSSGIAYVDGLKSQSANYYSDVAFMIRSENTSVVAPTLVWRSVEVGNYTDSTKDPFATSSAYTSSFLNGSHYNWVRYTDTSGLSFCFAIPVQYYATLGPTERPMFYYNYQKLYYYDGYTSDTTNSEYQQGFNTGYQDGYNVGSQVGYDTGYAIGDNQGYGRGYNDALLDDHYTFLNFFGAVVDAPIKAFYGLFDINILGINMADFLGALLTLCVVLVVVKFVFLR